MIRVKSNWFKAGREKTPQELAGAMAFIAWRIAENMLKNLRRADFEIAVGPQYFAFLTEFLIFIVQVADRIAYQRMDGEQRVLFTSTLANRVANNLAENQQRLLACDLAGCKEDFINHLNGRSEDYAEFEFDAHGPSFAFLRYFAHSLLEHLDEKDRHWVSDQIMAIEAPEAVSTVEKAMRGLLETEPRTRRAGSASGAD